MTDLKDLARAMMGDMNGGTDVDEWVDKYLAGDFVEHETLPGMDNTRETPRQLFKMMQTGFPDFRMESHDVIQEGDKIASRNTMSGTHEGEFMGMPATGNHFEIDEFTILRFSDGMCVEHWGLMDTAAMMEQLGAGAPH